jgi:molybdopterin-synthase adenylyltransferase
MLTTEEYKKYQKQILLDDFGMDGQLRLKQSKVAVVGAGGLGCPVLQYLTSVGIGTIGVIDFDKIELSNLHRQVLYDINEVGKPKVETAIEKLSKQNAHTKFKAHSVLLNEENAEGILAGYDLVIDGSDNFTTRYIVNDCCVKLRKPLVYGSILGYQGQLAVFNFEGSRNLRDIFPEPPNAEDVPSCSENGVLGTVPAIIGSMMAQETIRVLLGKPSLLNSILIFDCINFIGRKLNY